MKKLLELYSSSSSNPNPPSFQKYPPYSNPPLTSYLPTSFSPPPSSSLPHPPTYIPPSSSSLHPPTSYLLPQSSSFRERMKVPLTQEEREARELFDFSNEKTQKNYESEIFLFKSEVKKERNREKRVFLETLVDFREELYREEESLIFEIEKFRFIWEEIERERREGVRREAGRERKKEEIKLQAKALLLKKNQLENRRLELLERLRGRREGGGGRREEGGLTRDEGGRRREEGGRRNLAGIEAGMAILNKDRFDEGEMKERIRESEKKLYDMKKSFLYNKDGIVTPYDTEEIAATSPLQSNLPFLLLSADSLPTLSSKAAKLSQIRSYIEEYGLKLGIQKARVELHWKGDERGLFGFLRKNLEEIGRVRKEYLENGGEDREVLGSLERLEKFYVENRQLFEDKNEMDDMSKFANISAIENKSQAEFKESKNGWETKSIIPGLFDGSLLQSENKSMIHTDASNIWDGLNTNNPIKDDFSRVDRMIRKNSRSLIELQMKMSGLDPGVEESFRGKRSLFLKDGFEIETEEEKMLKKIITEEGDALRNLAKLPYQSELYYMKLAQIQPLILYRMELEKIVQEQRFARQSEDYPGLSNEVLRTKKSRISSHLRSNLVMLPPPRLYDPFSGFLVHFDFLLSLPKKFKSLKVNFGVFCKGETYYGPRNLQERKREGEGLAFLGAKEHIYDVVGRKETILVVEAVGTGEDSKMEVYGWTMLELFDMKGELLRGKFKIPFYSNKIKPEALVDELKGLKAVGSTLLFLRISFPQDTEYGYEEIAEPIKIQDEYFIPFIHRSTLLQPNTSPPPPSASGIWLPKSTNFSKYILPPPSPAQSQEKQPISLANIESNNQLEQIAPPPLPIDMQGNMRKGLYLKINAVKDFLFDGKIMILVGLTDDENILKDEKGQLCAFKAGVYEVEKDAYNENARVVENSKLKVLEMNEEYIFFTDLPYICRISNSFHKIFLVFQIMSSSPPTSNPSSHLVDQNVNEDSDDFLYGISWLAFPVFIDENLNVGRHVEHLKAPPMYKPPFVEGESKEEVIDFTIEEYIYDINQVGEAMEMLFRRRDLNQKRREKERRKRKDLWNSLDLDKRPFIQNLTPKYHDRPFEKGYGIDFYVDGARFLPDNVTVSKIVVFFLNQNLDRMVVPQAALPDLDSFSYMTMFNFRQELRAPHFDPTLMALVSVETIDQSNKEVRIVGYAGINFFLGRTSLRQPTKETETDVILMDGAYQLPIYCQEPIRKKPFNMEKIIRLDRIPCASLLVRVQLAPMTDDGLRALTLNDVPQKDWEKKKIWLPTPPYGLGIYNTSLCELRDSEKDLFFIRQKREDCLVKDNALRMMNYEGITDEITYARMKDWISEKIKRTNNTQILDMIYFAKYQPSTGFKFSLDGYHNVPNTSLPLIGLYCLNPPAAFYSGNFDPKSILLNSNFDWDSPLSSPKYNEGFFTWRDLPFNKYLNIIVDVRTVSISERKDKVKIEPYSWAIVPVFTPNGYVRSGIYQIPMFKGEVNLNLLEQFRNNDTWETALNLQKSPKNELEFFDTMSCVVRLVDAQREGHFQIPFDYTRMNFSYLPPNKIGLYTYNSAVEQRLRSAKKLATLAPNKFKMNEYNEAITKAVVDNLGIKHFEKEKTGFFNK